MKPSCSQDNDDALGIDGGQMKFVLENLIYEMLKIDGWNEGNILGKFWLLRCFSLIVKDTLAKNLDSKSP